MLVDYSKVLAIAELNLLSIIDVDQMLIFHIKFKRINSIKLKVMKKHTIAKLQLKL